MPIAMPNTLRVLSLAGGGYLGLFTAVVLAELEARAGEPPGRRFDLIAGPSVGGILAIGVGSAIPLTALGGLFAPAGNRGCAWGARWRGGPRGVAGRRAAGSTGYFAAPVAQ